MHEQTPEVMTCLHTSHIAQDAAAPLTSSESSSMGFTDLEAIPRLKLGLSLKARKLWLELEFYMLVENTEIL